MTRSRSDSMPEQLALPLSAKAPGLPLPAEPNPEAAFARVFRRLGLERPVPDFRVEYRPFAGLRSSIRLRDGRAQVLVSDLMTAAPPLVLEALAEILLTQVFRRRPSREARECYLAYVSAPAMRRRIDEARRERGTKRLLPPQGECYDLERIFAKLNRRFFRSRLARPRLGWSRKRSRALLGHYDAAHRTITISRWLDSPSVPHYLVEYLVFHEMLHMKFPVGRKGHRRILHPPEFREAEKQFPKYEQARRRLKLMSGRVG
jgi:hypothetical protein